MPVRTGVITIPDTSPTASRNAAALGHRSPESFAIATAIVFASDSGVSGRNTRSGRGGFRAVKTGPRNEEAKKGATPLRARARAVATVAIGVT